jgi:hypothetical protein
MLKLSESVSGYKPDITIAKVLLEKYDTFFINKITASTENHVRLDIHSHPQNEGEHGKYMCVVDLIPEMAEDKCTGYILISIDTLGANGLEGFANIILLIKTAMEQKL